MATNATCPMCRRLFSVTSCGLLRVHGPLSNRCAGSGQAPLSITTSSSSSPTRGLADMAKAPASSQSSSEASSITVSLPTVSVDHSPSSSPAMTSCAEFNNSAMVEHDATQVDAAGTLDRSETSFSNFLDMLDEAVPDDVSFENNDGSRAECPVRHRWFHFTTASFLRTHGPHGSRCPGSQQPIIAPTHGTTTSNLQEKPKLISPS